MPANGAAALVIIGYPELVGAAMFLKSSAYADWYNCGPTGCGGGLPNGVESLLFGLLLS